MQHPALPAVHGIKAERCARPFDVVRGCLGADPEFSDANGPVIVGVERNARMIIGMQTQHFLRNQFERQKQLRAIGQQKLNVSAGKFDQQIRALFRITVVAGLECEIECKARISNSLPQELFDCRSGFVY